MLVGATRHHPQEFVGNQCIPGLSFWTHRDHLELIGPVAELSLHRLQIVITFHVQRADGRHEALSLLLDQNKSVFNEVLAVQQPHRLVVVIVVGIFPVLGQMPPTNPRSKATVEVEIRRDPKFGHTPAAHAKVGKHVLAQCLQLRLILAPVEHGHRCALAAEQVWQMAKVGLEVAACIFASSGDNRIHALHHAVVECDPRFQAGAEGAPMFEDPWQQHGVVL